ncbi:ERAD-associated E3 ubiquitin-protein ligase component Hrd3p [Monosporozyma servazzii]
MKVATILNRIIVPLSFLIKTTYAINNDSSWLEAQKLMTDMTIRIDPISDSTLYLGDAYGITFTIPIDYIPEYEAYKHEAYWVDDANTKQKQLYDLLRDSADNHSNVGATHTLMRNFLYQEYDFPQNKKLAFQYLDKFNELTNYTCSETLFHQGVMYMTGFLGEIPIDEAKGLLLIQKSANLHNLKAKQTLAYKYLHGINVPRDIEKALLLYHDISHELKSRYFTQYDWDVITPYIEGYNIRLPDFDGGLLDPELRQTGLSTNRKKSIRPDITSSVLTKMSSGNIVLQFGDIGESSPFAINGENDDSSDQLVDIFYAAWDEYRGTYTKERNCTRAIELLELVYNKYQDDVHMMDNLQKFFYCNSLDLLGHLYFTGEGLAESNIDKAVFFLNKSKYLLEESPSSLVSRANIDLGLISQFYFGNISQAIKYYQKAIHIRTNNGIVEYQLSKLSEMLPNEKLGDPFTLMKTANWKGYNPARFEFAKMIEKSDKNKYDSADIANIYKRFVEASEHVMAPYLRDAFSQLLMGNSEVSLWYYTLAAEQGFEAAQISAASLLYQIPYKREELPITPKERQVLAASYYTRAFKQDNIDAGVIAGDVYFNMGDYEKAFTLYQGASGRHSPQALWNMGYMYENGLGIPKDYFLAKRFYDEVYLANSKLLLASKMSTWKLELKQWIDWLNNGEDTFWRRRWHRLCFNTLRVKNYIQSWVTAKRLPHKLVVQNEGTDNDKLYNTARRSVNHNVGDSNPGSTAGDDDSFEILGFTSQDLTSMLIMLLTFLTIVFVRHMAIRGNWNIVVNGVRINGGNNHNDNNNDGDQNVDNNGQPQPAQNGWGNVDIQVFAI